MLFCGDCFEVMDKIEDGMVDMVLTDPPYSSGGLTAGERKKTTAQKYGDQDYKGINRLPSYLFDNMDGFSFLLNLRLFFTKCLRVLKPGGMCAVFCDWRQLPTAITAMQLGGIIYRGIVVWDKKNGRPTPDRYRPDCEYVIWGTKGDRPAKMEKGCKVLPGCYHIPIVQSKDRVHQSEKPVALLEKLLAICKEGDVVLDPFMGSGSTGEACEKLNLEFIGIEYDKVYFDTACKKIQKIREEEDGHAV